MIQSRDTFKNTPTPQCEDCRYSLIEKIKSRGAEVDLKQCLHPEKHYSITSWNRDEYWKGSCGPEAKFFEPVGGRD